MKKDLCERTFNFAVQIVKLCKKLEAESGISRALSTQLFYSGTSIGANIEDAQSASSKADFISKYSIACQEARKTKYWLRLLKATGLSEGEDIAFLEQENYELVAILITIIKNSKENE